MRLIALPRLPRDGEPVAAGRVLSTSSCGSQVAQAASAASFAGLIAECVDEPGHPAARPDRW